MSECPVCGASVALETDTLAGELKDCTDCGSELEVVSITPPELAEAPQAAEDWGE